MFCIIIEDVVELLTSVRFLFIISDFICFIDEFKQQLIDQENQLNSEVKRLKTELDESRSQLTVLSLELQSKLEEETRKHQELSSLQHLLNGNFRLIFTFDFVVPFLFIYFFFCNKFFILCSL